MANGTVGIDEPAAIDKRMDTEELTVAATTVQRERVQVAGATDVGIAVVTDGNPAATDYGLVTRPITETAAGALFAKITDGTDTALVSASGELSVIPPATTNAGATAKTADYDTGAGTDTVTMVGVALPGAGGAVAGGTATNPIRVDPTGTTTQPVTANAGTNLNTSLLALESGGNLASAVTALQLIDNIVHTEDEASADGHSGALVLARRTATPANTSGADLDYEALQMNAGRLWVDASGVTLTVASHAVTNAGTFAVQVDGSALTALQLIDDPVFTDDAAFTPATSKVMMAGFEVDETATDSVDEGDAGAARMSADRKQYVIAHGETSTIYQNGTGRTPVFAIIDAATSGDNTLVAAQGAGNKIRVYAAFLVAAGTVNVRFESGAAGTALTGQMNLVANTGFVLPFNPLGWFETAANTLLNLELSAAISVDGCLVYSIVT